MHISEISETPTTAESNVEHATGMVEPTTTSQQQNERITEMTERLLLIRRRRQILNNLSFHSPPNTNVTPQELNEDNQDENLEIADLLGQGDNRTLENFWRNFNQNIVVNVNMSSYFKIMMIILSLNSLLLFKILAWDPFILSFF
ncbi:hypothetical protein HHI36_015986 [Cryptolaemus montrouzieri]|uniref:Uncharacterized protein n=1 Tax=Cryptolaemus montrouzieri TaxID=559131 RepID=A0ABD2N747_9CUCU